MTLALRAEFLENSGGKQLTPVKQDEGYYRYCPVVAPPCTIIVLIPLNRLERSLHKESPSRSQGRSIVVTTVACSSFINLFIAIRCCKANSANNSRNYPIVFINIDSDLKQMFINSHIPVTVYHILTDLLIDNSRSVNSKLTISSLTGVIMATKNF